MVPLRLGLGKFIWAVAVLSLLSLSSYAEEQTNFQYRGDAEINDYFVRMFENFDRKEVLDDDNSYNLETQTPTTAQYTTAQPSTSLESSFSSAESYSYATESYSYATESYSYATKSYSYATESYSSATESYSSATESYSSATESYSSATEPYSSAAESYSFATELYSYGTDINIFTTESYSSAAEDETFYLSYSFFAEFFSYSYDENLPLNCTDDYDLYVESGSSCKLDVYFDDFDFSPEDFCNISEYYSALFANADPSVKADCLNQSVVSNLLECVFDYYDDDLCPTQCYSEIKHYRTSQCGCNSDMVEIYAKTNLTNAMVCNETVFYENILDNTDDNCVDCEEVTDLLSCYHSHIDLECELTCETLSLESAMFNSFGTSITLTFDKLTDRAGLGTSIFDCSELLDFSGASDVECKWTSSKSLMVAVTGGLMLTAEDDITVLSKLIFYEGNSKNCDSSFGVNETTVSVEVPVDAFTPSVSFGSVPNMYDSCVDISMDVSGSVAGCSPTYSWNLVDSSDPSNDALSTFVQSQNTSSFTITNDNLNGGNWYAISAQITNCFMLSANATANFTLASAPLPTLAIAGGSAFSIYRSNSLTLTAQAAATECDTQTCESGLTFSWSIPKYPELSYSTYGNKMVLESDTFNASSTYNILCQVMDCFNRTNSQTIVITVLSSDLVAAISGGASRVVSTMDSFELDGSNSYDPDGGEINYLWNCTDAVGAPCNITGEGQTLEVPAGTLEDDDSREPYVISLQVTSTSDDRFAITYQSISVMTDAVPIIEITTTSTKLNPSTTNVISATVDTTGGDVSASWSLGDGLMEYGNGKLTPNVLGPVSKEYAEDAYGGLATFNIVLKSGAIDTEGSSYTLTFTATFEDTGASSYATLSFVSNVAPSSGLISVSPTTGTELITEFSATLSGWVDDDTPLQYRFFTTKNTASNTQQPVQGQSYTNTAEGFLLPEGSNYIIGYVIDNLGAEATVTSEKIAVEESVGYSIANLTSVASAALSSALSDGNYDLVASTLSALSSAVVDDSIDCTSATGAYCQSLNRENCSETANTCGECLDGYDGTSGDSNSLCVIPAEACKNGVQDGLETDVDCGGDCLPCGLGSDCLSDLDCESTACEVNMCVEPTKTCPTTSGVECNNAGTCKYKNKMSGKEKPASWCRESNSICTAYCECNATYSGESCDMTEEDVEAANAAVTVVYDQVEAVLETFGDQVSSDDIETYAAILSSSSGNAQLFDADTADSALSVLTAIIPTDNDDVEISEDAADSLMETISNLFGYSQTSDGNGRRLTVRHHRMLLTSIEQQLVKSATSVCTSLASQSTEGFVSEVAKDEIQMVYGCYFGADLCAFVDQSQTESQESSGIVAAGIKQCSGSVSDSQIQEICTMDFLSSDSPDGFISTIYLVSTAERDSSSRRQLTTNSDVIRIGFIEEMDWMEQTTLSLTGTCPANISYTEGACAGYDLICTDDRSYNLECISNSSYPICTSYNNATDAWEACTTLNYTSTYIYCDCSGIDGTYIAESVHETGSVDVNFYTIAPTTAPTNAQTDAPGSVKTDAPTSATVKTDAPTVGSTENDATSTPTQADTDESEEDDDTGNVIGVDTDTTDSAIQTEGVAVSFFCLFSLIAVLL